MWSAGPKEGKFQLYLDGVEQPTLDVRFRQFFDATAVVRFPVTAKQFGEGVFIIGTVSYDTYVSAVTGSLEPYTFQRGDASDDGLTDMTDAIVILGMLFLRLPPTLPCDKAADVDDSGVVDLTDPINLLSHLFLGFMAPASPYLECGVDPTPDLLDCDSYPHCP